MEKVETGFRTQKYQPLVWYWYIDHIFYTWTHSENRLKQFLEKLNEDHHNPSFTHKFSRQQILFLNLMIGISNELYTDLHVKCTDSHQYLDYASIMP